MKVLFKLFVIFIAASLSPNSYAFPELPFCPAGGPPGWMNHFNYKRDQNIWRRYSQQASPAYTPPARYRPYYGYGNTPAYNYNQNYSQPGTMPSRKN